MLADPRGDRARLRLLDRPRRHGPLDQRQAGGGRGGGEGVELGEPGGQLGLGDRVEEVGQAAEGRAGSRDRRPATDELGQRPLRHTDSLSPTTDNPSGALPAAGCPQGGGGGGAFVGSVGQTGPQD